MLLQMTLFCSFIWLSSIPLYKCTISLLSIHLSVDIQVASMSWLLWILLLWIMGLPASFWIMILNDQYNINNWWRGTCNWIRETDNQAKYTVQYTEKNWDLGCWRRDVKAYIETESHQSVMGQSSTSKPI